MFLLNKFELLLCTWSLGRITEVIRGADGHVRAVELHNAKGNFKLTISKISILLIKEN